MFRYQLFWKNYFFGIAAPLWVCLIKMNSKNVGFESERVPNEVWCLILRNSNISSLLELRRVNSRFYSLVDQNAAYQSYIKEEEKILHALGIG